MSRDRKQEISRSHGRKEAQQGIPLVQQSDVPSQQALVHSSSPLQQSDNPVQYSNNNRGQFHTSEGSEHPRAPAPLPAQGPRPPYQYNYQRPNIYTNPHPAPLLPHASGPGHSLLPLATDPSVGMYGYKPRYIKKKDYKKYGHEIYGNDRKVNQFNSNSLPSQLHRKSTEPQHGRSADLFHRGSANQMHGISDASTPYQMAGRSQGYQMPPDGQYPTQPPSRPDPFPDIPYIDHGSNQSLNQSQNETPRQPNRGYTEYYDWTEHSHGNGFHGNSRNNPRYAYGSHPILYHSDYQDNVSVPQYGASNYHQGDYVQNDPPPNNPPRHDSSDLGFYDLSYTSLPTSDLGLLNSAPILNPSRQYRDASYRNSGQRSQSHGNLENDITPGSQMTYLRDHHPGDHPGASNKGWSTLPRNFSHNQDNVPGLQEKHNCHSDGDESQKAFYVLAKPKSEKSQPIDTGSNAYFLSRV